MLNMMWSLNHHWAALSEVYFLVLIEKNKMATTLGHRLIGKMNKKFFFNKQQIWLNPNCTWIQSWHFLCRSEIQDGCHCQKNVNIVTIWESVWHFISLEAMIHFDLKYDYIHYEKMFLSHFWATEPFKGKHCWKGIYEENVHI